MTFKGFNLIVVFLFSILFVVVFTGLVSAQSHSLCGQVNDAIDCRDPAWRTVNVYYPEDPLNIADCQISPENNRFCCDVDDIPNHNWEIGDIISSRVIDTGDGYYTEAVNTTMTGNGFDIAPEVNLTSDNLKDPPINGTCLDTDTDLINDIDDNCVLTSNVFQTDFDSDGFGDVCDNCFNVSNPDQFDHDLDGAGNACDVVMCGDSIHQNLTLTEDLTCFDEGLKINESGVLLDCDRHAISLGISQGTFYGITLNGVNDSVIRNCLIRDWDIGILATNSHGNLIYNNHFNNTINAFDDGNNFWNLPMKELWWWNIVRGAYWGGNFWHDYTGNDTTNNGIGDTKLPYDSNGNIQNGGDVMPLLYPVINVVNVTPINATILRPTTLRLNSIESNYVDDVNPDTVMCAGCEFSIFRKVNSTGKEIRTYLKFNLSNRDPVNKVVNKSTLYFYVSDFGSNDPRSFKLYSINDVDDNWKEINITWNNAPILLNEVASFNTVPQEGKWHSIDVTNYLSTEYSSGNDIVTLVFTADVDGPINQWSIDTEESSHKPLLLVKTSKK